MGRVEDETGVTVDTRENNGDKHQVKAVVGEFSNLELEYGVSGGGRRGLHTGMIVMLEV